MDNNSIKMHIKKIIRQLNIVENDLSSAKSWGIFDILAGGVISSLVKRDKIKSAESNYKDVLYELRILKKELNEFVYDNNYIFTTSSLNQFLDIFMDNIFSDLLSQSKINESLNQINNLKSELNFIYHKL